MTYAILTDDGAILGSFHATEREVVTEAKASARRMGVPVRVVGYGESGEVKSIREI